MKRVTGAAGRPKLLLVIGSLECGGAERQLSDIANSLAAEGLEVIVATVTGPQIDDFYRLHEQVRRKHLVVPAPRVRVLSTIRMAQRRVGALRALVRELQPDAVLSFITESNVMTILACRGLRTRVVISERVQPALHTALPWTWKLLRKLTYRWADAVVAQTRDAAEWIRVKCRKPALVIPNALRPLPQSSAARDPLVIAVGRLAPQKGFDLLLRAFARASAEFSDWRLTIFGEGGERARLIQLSEDLQIAGRVTFAGQVQPIEPWLARAAIVAQPSRFEGFPNVVLEAMGMGAAVISSDCRSGPSDLIVDGVNGRLVPVEDIDSLTSALAELMGRPELRERFGREALQVRQRFEQQAIVAQWKACLLPQHAGTADAT